MLYCQLLMWLMRTTLNHAVGEGSSLRDMRNPISFDEASSISPEAYGAIRPLGCSRATACHRVNTTKAQPTRVATAAFTLSVNRPPHHPYQPSRDVAAV